jgi:hypothetical protein
MPGAANNTTGSIVIHAKNVDLSQWIKKVSVEIKEKLAIPAAIEQVRPD